MQIANISLNNSAAVAKSFIPTIKNGLLAVYMSREGARPALFPNLTIGLRQSKQGVSRKVTVKVTLPYDVTVGSTVTTESVTAFVDIVIPDSAIALNVDDLLSYASDALRDAQVKDTCVNGAFPY